MDDCNTGQNGGNGATAPGHRADRVPTLLSPAGHMTLPDPHSPEGRCSYSHFLREKNQDPVRLNACQGHPIVLGRAGVQTQHPWGGPAVQDPQGYSRDGLFWNPVFRIPVRISDRPLFLETHGSVLSG